jgi:hypothetical protein
VPRIAFLQSKAERLQLGIQGTYPDHMLESTRGKTSIRHPVNEALTRPWIRHHFIMEAIRENGAIADSVVRDSNIIDIVTTTIPLPENSFVESTMSSWRMFIESAYRDADAPWYSGIRKVLSQERFYTAIEQLELEPPESNSQRQLHFLDHDRVPRKVSRLPIKLIFSLPGNEKEKLLDILRRAVRTNPHNLDVALLTFCFFKVWDRTADFLELARQERRKDLEEWFHWVENDTRSVGAIHRAARNYTTVFYLYERSLLDADDYREAAQWFLKENEFKSAYHFFAKAKEFETALDLLQNISTKEFAELTNMRRIARGEKPLDLSGEGARLTGLHQEEVETLRGFARIRAAEMYKQVAAKARQNFDRETIETKYAFGELSEEEYHRLMRQVQERKQ